jgi:basic membrane protein A
MPFTLAYLTTAATPSAVFGEARFMAETAGWAHIQMPTATPQAVRDLAASGAGVIIAEGAALREAILTAAAEFPQTYFISLGSAEAPTGDLPANVLIFATPRDDQTGFMAGAAAGFATQTQRVGVVSNPATLSDRLYRTGFLHGVRYACPRCDIDLVDILDALPATAAQQATFYATHSTDVIFAPPGPLGEAAWPAAAQNGAFVIGAGADVYQTAFVNGTTPGADLVLTSVWLNPAQAVRQALTAYQLGTPYAGLQALSAQNGGLVLAPYRTTRLSGLDITELAAILDRLASGDLDTGVDPLTGEER